MVAAMKNPEPARRSNIRERSAGLLWRILGEKFNAHLPPDAAPAPLAAAIRAQYIAADGSRERRMYYMIRLADLIESHAAATGKTVMNPLYGETVDEEFYRHEIDALSVLQKSFSISDSFNGWVKERRAQFVKAMIREKPYGWLSQQWQDASMDGRLNLLQEVMDLQRRVYSEDSIAFAQTAVTWDKDMSGCYEPINGYTVSSLRTEQMPGTDERGAFVDYGRVTGVSVLRIGFRGATVDMEPTLKVAHHEQLHALIGQLCDAAVSGRMDAKHPLYGDVLNLTNMKMIAQGWNRLIPVLYENDPEERICCKQQEAFMGEYVIDSVMLERKRQGPVRNFSGRSNILETYTGL